MMDNSTAKHAGVCPMVGVKYVKHPCEVQMCTLCHTKSAGLCADHEFGSH